MGHDESRGGRAGCLASAISIWVASDSSAQIRGAEEAGVAGCPSCETMRREAVIIQTNFGLYQKTTISFN